MNAQTKWQIKAERERETDREKLKFTHLSLIVDKQKHILLEIINSIDKYIGSI